MHGSLESVDDALRRENRLLRALHETTVALMQRLELGQLLQGMLERATALLETSDGFLGIVEDNGAAVRIALSTGEANSEIGLRIDRGEGVAGRVLETREPMVVNAYSRWEGKARRGHVDYWAIAEVPLLKPNGELFGVLGIATLDERRTFGEVEIDVLKRFADLAAVALRNAEIFEAERAARTQAEQMLESLRAISSSLDLGVVLGSILKHLCVVVPCDSASVQEIHDNKATIVAGIGFDDLPSVLGISFELSNTNIPNGLIVERREPIVLGDVRGFEDFRKASPASGGIRSWMGVPLLSGEEVIGILTVDKSEPSFYTAQHARTAMAYAAQAAVAMQNARLYTAAQHAREAADAASAAKSAFLAAMSHELRTPLNAIIGFSSVLEQTVAPQLTDRQQRFIRNIHTSGEYLLGIINDILDLSKIEAGKMTVDTEMVNVAEIIEGIRRVAKGIADPRRIELTVEAPDDLPRVEADPIKLKQILYNLVSNAVKFSGDGKVVTIAASPLAAADSPIGCDSVQVSVIDQGMGIDPADQELIFEEFHQVRPDASRPAGTGLGLALVRHLLKLHGGTITVRSERGKGSEFTFVMPRRLPA